MVARRKRYHPRQGVKRLIYARTGAAWVCACGMFPDAPMIKHHLWKRVAEKRDLLCIACVEKKLGRELTEGDLLNVPVNAFTILLADRASQ